MTRRQLTTAIIIFIICGIKGQRQEEIEFSCGRRLVRHRPLITNGFESNEGDWPWHAAIYHFVIDKGISYRCGGTVLNSNSILTASHCVYENNRRIIPERILVQLGKHNLKVSGTNTQEFEVYKIVTHPDYSASDLSNDIAILRLSTEAVFNKYVQPICLWDSSKRYISEIIGRNGIVIGWGVTEADQLSYILRQAVMPVVPSLMCLQSNRDFFGGYLSEKNFCAGFRNGTGVCNGDSGGSISFEENGVYYIRGIVSLTVARKDKQFCDTNEYVIFTDVAQYLPWIEVVVPQLKRSHLEPVPVSRTMASISPSTTTTTISSSEPSIIVKNEEPEDVSTHRNLYLLPLNTCGDIFQDIVEENVFGGKKANLFEFPWMVRLEFYNVSARNVEFLCSGTLISSRYVLTAAHCVTKLKKTIQLVGARLGEYDVATSLDCQVIENIERCAPPVQDITVEKVISHPMYNVPRFANDIAVLRLSRAANIAESVRPVCLPTTFRSQKTILKKASNTGWGYNYTTQQTSSILHQRLLPIVPNNVCQTQFYKKAIAVTSNQICAGGEAGVRAGCKGDSGGPLIYPSNVNGLRMVLFGILSSGVANCSSTILFPDIYVKVANYMRWILDQLEPYVGAMEWKFDNLCVRVAIKNYFAWKNKMIYNFRTFHSTLLDSYLVWTHIF